jgi:hypothetical protein
VANQSAIKGFEPNDIAKKQKTKWFFIFFAKNVLQFGKNPYLCAPF